jgi:hypothetical protein
MATPRWDPQNLPDGRRLTNLVLKLKRYERQRESLEERPASDDILETKEVSGLAP